MSSENELNRIAINDLELDLMLPDWKLQRIEGRTFFSFSRQEIGTIVKIYNTYAVIGKINKELSRLIELKEQKNQVLTVALYKCTDTLKAVDEERVLIHSVRDSEKLKAVTRDRKSKIKTILIGAGSGVVGVGLGLIIGMFAVRR